MAHLPEIAELVGDVWVFGEQFDEVIGSEHVVVLFCDAIVVIVGFDLGALLGASALVLLQFLFELAGGVLFLIENA